MENKKIDTFFGIVVIAFLAIVIILLKEFNTKRANDYKTFVSTIRNIEVVKNSQIKNLANQLAAKERENQDLKSTLSDTRTAIESLSKKLTQPAPVAAPVAVPAVAPVAVPAVAAPVAKTPVAPATSANATAPDATKK